MLQRLSREALAVTIGQHSEAGRKPSNQDFHGMITPEGSTLAMKGISLAIADGISSSNVGHVAAEIAVKSFLTDYYCTSEAWSVKTAGHRVISATNSWLHSATRRHRLHEDMNRGFVCAFSSIVIKGRTAYIFHVGDTRVFRLASGTLEQLTTDHRTYVSSTESYLARALGLSARVEMEFCVTDLRVGDVLVMTTDGVHDYVPNREMATIIAGSSALDVTARAIVAKALENGSDDNLTIQIARIDALPQRDALDFLQDADVLPPAPLPHVPFVYDGYRIIQQIHGSDRSHIFLAIDMDAGTKVAFKVPSLSLRDNIDYLRRFAMEDWIARRIDSPHVLKAAPTHRERDTLYLVTEFIEGKTLRQWMLDNPLPDLETVRGIVEQIAAGLRAFHRKEMIHQDLRPENVMIDRNGTVKIIDFGAVQVAGVLEASPDLEMGDILGTHQYAAPEYFLGESGTNRSDLYSLGVIAYELLTGRLPYDARMAQAPSRARQERVSYTPMTTYRRDLPGWIDEAIKKAVHFDPSRRQEALSEFTNDLRRVGAGGGTSRPAPLIERNPLLFWKIVSAVLTALLLVSLFWRLP